MKKFTTEQKLDQLSEFQAQADLLQLELQKLLDEAMTPEEREVLQRVKQKQDEIRAEFDGKSEAVSGKIEALRIEITAEVLESGQTAKGQFLTCQYTKGRITWDAKILDGFAIAHPEVLFARKEGQPFTTFKAVK